jgi:hypothetical protein
MKVFLLYDAKVQAVPEGSLVAGTELVHETGAFIYSPIIDALAVEGNRSLQAGSAISTG